MDSLTSDIYLTCLIIILALLAAVNNKTKNVKDVRTFLRSTDRIIYIKTDKVVIGPRTRLKLVVIDNKGKKIFIHKHNL